MVRKSIFFLSEHFIISAVTSMGDRWCKDQSQMCSWHFIKQTTGKEKDQAVRSCGGIRAGGWILFLFFSIECSDQCFYMLCVWINMLQCDIHLILGASSVFFSLWPGPRLVKELDLISMIVHRRPSEGRVILLMVKQHICQDNFRHSL